MTGALATYGGEFDLADGIKGSIQQLWDGAKKIVTKALRVSKDFLAEALKGAVSLGGKLNDSLGNNGVVIVIKHTDPVSTSMIADFLEGASAPDAPPLGFVMKKVGPALAQAPVRPTAFNGPRHSGPQNAM